MKLHWIVVLVSAFTLAGITANAQDDMSHSVQLYNTYCVQCHGVNRNGKGINSGQMSVQPRDHTDAKGMGDIPDEEIEHAIRDGGLAVNKSVLMPTWGKTLSQQDIEGLVKYLRTVCKCGNKGEEKQ